jgi:hypothetical protein
MPTLAQYRRAVAVESGPYIGPETYDVRATSGSDVNKLVCSNYPIKSGIAQNDLLTERPLYRPEAVQEHDRHRYVMIYDPPTGTLTPDLVWAMPPIAPPGGSSYDFLEPHTYADLELMLYEDMESLGLRGFGERFEVLGPFDVPTLHQLINDGLKQTWLVVDIACAAMPGITRHDLRLIAPWIQDANHIRQAGMLPAGHSPYEDDPFDNPVFGSVERDGGTFIFNSQTRTFNDGDTIYLRVYKRAYDHCRPAGGEYGDQVGLALETDEAPIERDWLAASALTVGWRRFGHILEPIANQRLVRDAATAAAWFADRSRQHFTAVAPTLTFRPKRRFGPAVRS